jgi:hypothetical protein
MIVDRPAPAAFALQTELEGVLVTLEHLAVQAAHAQQPCAQILFRTAELLRIAVIKR